MIDRGDRDWYRERQLTWLVRSAELEVLRPIWLGAAIVSRTAVVGQRRVWARRRGEFRLADGSLGGWVHTDWVVEEGSSATARPASTATSRSCSLGRLASAMTVAPVPFVSATARSP